MHGSLNRRQSALALPQGRITAGASVLAAIAMLLACGNAWAVPVTPGPHAFDASLTGNSFVSYDGTKFVTPALPPASTLGVTIDGGPLIQTYPSTSLTITSGFVASNVFVFDANANGITAGDAIFGSVGPSSFSVSDGNGVILTGSFTSATLASAVTASAGSLSASDITGLVLVPGPAFTFDNGFVSSIAPNPTGFSISLSSIPGGVGVAPAGAAIGPFFPVTLLPMALSSGSTVVSGIMVVVPEPTTVALLGMGVLALTLPAFRRLRRRNPLKVPHENRQRSY